jgi:hypothetical protein
MSIGSYFAVVIYCYVYFASFSAPPILLLYSGSVNELKISFINVLIMPQQEIAFDLNSFYFIYVFIDFYIEILLSVYCNHNPYLWDPRCQHLIISCLLKNDMIFY